MDTRWRALAILTIARTCLGFQFQSIPGVSTGLMQDLGLSYADLGFLVGLYFLPGIVVSMPAGTAGRRFGDTRLVLLGLALMSAGGLLAAFASSESTLIFGRLLSGFGAVVLNVLMSKMVTDWFAGREIALAMSIFVNSFPIGIGAALFVLPSISAAAGWQAGLLVAAIVPATALVFLLFAYVPHPNDRAQQEGRVQPRTRLGPRVLTLVCISGCMWGAINGAFTTMASFSAAHLVNAGAPAATAAGVVATATWAIVISVQAGGFLAQKWPRPAAIFILGCVGGAVCMLAAAWIPGLAAAAIVAAGLVLGLPIGLILALPSRVLQPDQRGVGMGIFYLWLYVGHAAIPALAGSLQHQQGSTAVSLVVVGVFALLILALYGAFRLVESTAAAALVRMVGRQSR